MTNRKQKKGFKYSLLGVFLTAGGSFSSLSNGEKGCPACIFKRWHFFQHTWKFLSLLLSGRITLKTILNYFRHYLTRVCEYANEHFLKVKWRLFRKYRCAPLFLHLKQWQNTNEAVSLSQILYVSKPRNPE